MESRYIQGVERKIKELAREYEKKGYSVITSPSVDSMPRFLKDFQPDLIAITETDKVVIEVKSSGIPTDYKELEEVARLIGLQENWRFELVFTNPKESLTFEKRSQVIGKHVIVSRISECQSLAETSHLEAAFLLAWSAIEAAIRLKAPIELIEKEDFSRKGPLHLIKSLYSLGVINQNILRKIEYLNELRNKLIHGFEEEISEAVINSSIDVIEYLIEEGDNSDIQEWLSNLDLDGYQEIYHVYNAIADVSEYFPIKVENKDGKFIIQSDSLEETLILKSEDARQEMLRFIEEEYMDGMDVESFYGFHRAMERDD